MRTSYILASATAFIASAYGACLNKAAADKVAANFQGLIANYSDELANSSLTVDYHDYSDSVIELENSGCTGPIPLGSATFTDRAGFEAGQGAQPPIPFELLNTWFNCDTVIMRWRTTVSANATEPVTGIIVLETVPAPPDYSGSDEWLIQTVYSEFNSGAWLVDIGTFVPTCNATTTKRSSRV